eukprot:scaffold23116_cov103-Isochrysis_galbana.AAC.3
MLAQDPFHHTPSYAPVDRAGPPVRCSWLRDTGFVPGGKPCPGTAGPAAAPRRRPRALATSADRRERSHAAEALCARPERCNRAPALSAPGTPSPTGTTPTPCHSPP